MHKEQCNYYITSVKCHVQLKVQIYFNDKEIVLRHCIFLCKDL